MRKLKMSLRAPVKMARFLLTPGKPIAIATGGVAAGIEKPILAIKATPIATGTGFKWAISAMEMANGNINSPELDF
jgi:hypothetical protein